MCNQAILLGNRINVSDGVSILGHKFVWQHNAVVGQAMVRMFFCVVCMTYAYVGWRYGWFGGPPAQLFYASVLFFGISIPFLFFAGFTRSMSWPFKVSGMTADISFATYTMIIGDTSTIFLYGIFLWIVIGNGLRFGRNYMFLSNVLSIIGFSIVITNGWFWQSNPYIGGGLMIWLVLMPLYISKLLRKLEVAVEQADRANNAKSEFLANMSHEIRTPLTTIIGFSEVAMDKDQSTEERISALKIIRRSGSHLLNLINNILDFSKIDAGELEIENIAMNPMLIVSEVESIMRIQAEKKSLAFNIQYHFPLPVIIKSDPVRLKQVLLNLCSNAIKFTEKGTVTIRTRYDEVTRTLTFSVSDTGIGLKPEQLHKVFKPFKQADTSTTRKYGGTGLGLSLSKQLAELLDGQLTAQSLFGHGTTFEFSIPCGEVQQDNLIRGVVDDEQDNLRDQNPKPGRTQGSQTIPLLSGTVLLVEDNEVNQQLITLFLQKMGATISVASNGKEAVDLALDSQFDLVYMDMQMPVMSGIDAVKTLRAAHYSKPIVMLTANATNQDRSCCTDAGCDNFLTKPITRETLYDMTSKYLALASDQDSFGSASMSQ